MVAAGDWVQWHRGRAQKYNPIGYGSRLFVKNMALKCKMYVVLILISIKIATYNLHVFFDPSLFIS